MYKKMVSIRNENEELIDGDIEFINSEEDILLFRRRLNNKYLYIAINRNLSEEREVILPEKSKVIYKKDLITTIRKPIINGSLVLKPLEGVILE
jgi:pullulanase